MAATASQVTLQFVSAADKSPIVGATVTAIIEAAQGIGASGTTDSHGRVDLALGGAQVQVESLYVYVQDGFWDLAAQNALLKDGSTFQLKSIDLTYVDLLRDLYDESSVTAGSGVTVGVIDSGIGPHQDLRVAGGCNVSSGPRENPTDYSDNGTGHGTHVGGIIASLGAPPTGIRGVAPGVTLRSYRAAPSGQRSMDNFAITKALKQAADDGCDLINISLSGGLRDDSTHSALAMARDKGCVIFAASGNDDGGPVGFPASDSLTLAVTAFGRKGTFPDGTLEASYTPLAQGRNPDDFVAPFDNYGVEIVLTAPGVGIISTYPNNRYAVMDGTSMACGAVTGAAAVLLSHNPAILQMPRDQNRSNAVAKLVLNAASSLGFPATMQGKGYIKI
jgi:subtilisin